MFVTHCTSYCHFGNLFGSMALHERKTWVTEACGETDHKILCAMWKDVEHCCGIAGATCGTHISLC
jgi:hypothetical protein